MIVHVSFCGSLLFRHIQRVIVSAGIQSVKDFHCAPVVNADDVPEPRLTLKQIEKKKLEKRRDIARHLKSRQRGFSQPKPAMKPSEFNANTDWSSVYQTARPYDPYLIPLPIRMGRAGSKEIPPGALHNAELLKIPNFFHLTPPAILKHCEALKPLCTKWIPEMEQLPLKVTTKTIAFSGRSLYHPESREVVLTINLKHLKLTEQARKKFIELAGSHYDADANELKLVGDKCPARHQNEEYVMYLLKVLYLEANKPDSPPTEQESTDGSHSNVATTSQHDQL